jgi:hypothetical protein
MTLSEFKNFLAFFAVSEQKRMLERTGRQAFSAIQLLEYHYTYSKFEKFMNDYQGGEALSLLALISLSDLLVKRQFRIKGTNSDYECDTANPANRLSFNVGLGIHDTTGMALSQVLMAPQFGEKSGLTTVYKAGRLETHYQHERSNDNDMFALMIDDVESHPLLMKVHLLKLYRELSEENQARLITALLNLGPDGAKHLNKSIKHFDHLFEFLACLDEQTKLRFLSETNCLDKLLKGSSNKRKTPYATELLKLAALFEDKKAVFELMSPDIRDLYIRREAEIRFILRPELIDAELLDLLPGVQEDRMVVDLAGELETKSVTVSTEGEVKVISLLSEEDEEVLEEGSELMKEPPKKKQRLSEDDQTAQVLVALSEPTAPAVLVVTASVPTFFHPRLQPASETNFEKTFYELFKKASVVNKEKRPLETLHYVERAYNALFRFSPEYDWRENQVTNLRSLAQEAINFLKDNWHACYHYYQSNVETKILLDWCASARNIAVKLLPGPQYVSILGDLEGRLATLKRYHPEYPTHGK